MDCYLILTSTLQAMIWSHVYIKMYLQFNQPFVIQSHFLNLFKLKLDSSRILQTYSSIWVIPFPLISLRISSLQVVTYIQVSFGHPHLAPAAKAKISPYRTIDSSNFFHCSSVRPDTKVRGS